MAETHQSGEVAPIVRLLPLRVLVFSPDRYFRAAFSALLERRGCRAFSAAGAEAAGTLLEAERVDVLVAERSCERAKFELCIDGMLHAERWTPAGADSARARPAIVVVAEEALLEGRHELYKWSPFEEVFAAIVDADRRRVLPRRNAPASSPRAAGAHDV